MSSYSTGQRVLCIDGKFHPLVWEFVNEVPLDGQIYTIREIRFHTRNQITGEIGPALALMEISGRLPGSSKEVSWDIARFKPIEEHDTATVGKRSRGRRNGNIRIRPRQLRPVTA